MKINHIALILLATLASPTVHADEIELSRKIDILAKEIETLKANNIGSETPSDASTATTIAVPQGFGPSAGKVYRSRSGVSIGGYGEMLYQNYRDKRDNAVGTTKVDDIDFLRNVVYIGYKFNDQWLFNTEIEFEHANTGSTGKVEVEFAYVDYLFRPEINFRAGMMLVPVGLTNELHEPTVFLGARRPEVEQKIIPTTWSENGAGIFGQIASIDYRTYIVAGLDADNFTSSGIRDGRQLGANSKVTSGWLSATRIDYSQIPGLLAGGSFTIGKSGRYPGTGSATTVDQSINPLPIRIYEAHVTYKKHGFELSALGALTTLQNVTELNTAKSLTGTSRIGEKMWGYYAQAGYDVFTLIKEEIALTPFVRYEKYDTQSNVPSSGASSGANRGIVWTYGINFKPIPQIVFKLDYQDFRLEDGSGNDQFNLALGFNY